MRLVMPAWFIKLPARMKNGTASSGKLSMPPIMRCTTTNGGRLPLTRMYASEAPAIARATGTPISNNNTNESSSMSVPEPLEAAAAQVLAEHERGAHGHGSERQGAHREHDVHGQIERRHAVVAELQHHLQVQDQQRAEEQHGKAVHDQREHAPQLL